MINKNTPLIIGKQVFSSRLMVGTGKYISSAVMKESIVSSGASIVTIAVRRLRHAYDAQLDAGLMGTLDWRSLWLLPNTAGCTTTNEAIRIASLGREIVKRLGQDDNSFVKLEVIPDCKYLLPDPVGTLKAAEYLVRKNFTVLPYISPDPILAKQLEEVGCAAIMPLGSLIGSGCGLNSVENLEIIIDNATIPVVIDAGIGRPSDASQAMELGADAVLVNSAIAYSRYPPNMALAMKLGVQAGRQAYVSGLMSKQHAAVMSSPLDGISR